jgi:ZIP family zinc transporter
MNIHDVLSYLGSLNPVLVAFLATFGTYLLTALGTTPVFLLKHSARRLMNLCSAFAAGVMVAASCWSLLVPALERGCVFPAAVGLAIGGAFMLVTGGWIKKGRVRLPGQAEPKSDEENQRQQGPVMLMIAMTVHNFPEGLAIGVAYGAGGIGTATALALGIGLQNIPEGLAIALPLRRQGMSRWRAFFWGQLSAAVEPVAGVLGAALVLLVAAILPYGMAFAAGAMLYVTVQELIPEAIQDGEVELAGLAFLVGFTLMMALDTAFQ